MSSQCTVDVDPGVCRLHSTITATMDDEGNIAYQGKAECKHVQELLAKIGTISPMEEFTKPINKTKVYETAGDCLPHAACPVPCGMVKAMEAAAGLGLKRDVIIKIS